MEPIGRDDDLSIPFDDGPAEREARVRAAVEQADLNALRLALIQVTGDQALADMEVERVPYRGGTSHVYRVAEHHWPELREKAIRYLDAGLPTDVRSPSRDEARRLMQLFTGEPLTDVQFDLAHEEIAFADFPHEVQWTDGAAPAGVDGFHVVIIGAGISGIAMGVQLKRLGIPFTMLERQLGVGGTWLLNDYPEARVDVGSHHYQFKFEKDYPWKERFASQAATRTYLEHVVRKYGLDEHIRTGVEVQEARWEEDTNEWLLDFTSSDGRDGTMRGNVVVSCSGLFSTPKIPDFPGMETYQGTLTHTSAWDHGFELSGSSVALIGNGSSGVQLMPFLARNAGELAVFQRTAQWMNPVGDYSSKVSPEVQWLFRTLPFYWNWFMYGQFIANVGLQKAQEYDSSADRAGGPINPWNEALRTSLTDYIHTKVGEDEQLLAKVLPDYAPLGRRLVVDNGWYDALHRSNVELVTEGIESFTPEGIRTADGRERRFDLVVLATGFEVSKYFNPVKYVGRLGASLDDLWAVDGARAHLGMVMPGMPNFFSFYGPNGQTRAGGFYFWAGSWSHYAGSAIVSMIENGWKSLEVTRAAYDDYNTRLDEAMTTLLWAAEGQSGYYTNEFGRPGVNMPWRAEEYHQMIKTPDFTEYDIA